MILKNVILSQHEIRMELARATRKKAKIISGTKCNHTSVFEGKKRS